MSVPLVFAQTVTQGALQYGGSRTVSADELIQLSHSVAGGSTNSQFAIAFAHSNVVAYMFMCDRDIDIKFNSTSSPAPDLQLKANQPEMWHNQMGGTSIFAADVTTAYATLAAGASATITGFVLVNP